ncbi:hypothetical protein [Granulicella sibirica]|uniref:Antitoxin n=1 Tax=Granulicella sibirica TaxID=2479048 RepID=A0A4V1L5Y4_9BACT|nr:hypothetical protein [Granulicella sibirica]RXH57374.1 hypothetical protein GRAN_0684 [Granulicella sibirica]
MKVSAQYAEVHFPELLAAARNGELVEIADPDKPTLRLVVSDPAPEPLKRSGRRILGAGEREMRVPSLEEWQAMDADLEREMFDAPLMTSGKV